MSGDPYRLRQENFAHVLWLGLLPLGLHFATTVFFGLEAETAFAMLLSAALAAFFSGAYLGKKGYGAPAAALAAAWPAVLASHWRWHWAAGLSSPGSAAQSLVRVFGWTDASMTAAVAVITVAAGGAGWLGKRFDRWYKRKTGRSLFEES